MRYLLRISLLVLAMVSTRLFAHPHSFIDFNAEVTADEGGFTQIVVQWLFDEYFTESIIIDYDVDKDGHFNENETKTLYDEAFINVEIYNYFLNIELGDSSVRVDSVSDFIAELSDGRLHYQFTVPLPRSEARSLTIMSYDPTYFIYIEMKSEDDFHINVPAIWKYHTHISERLINFDMYGELPVKAYWVILDAK